MTLNERLLTGVLSVQGERVAEFILPLLDDSDDWTLAQLVLTSQLPDDSDWSAFPDRIGFDLAAQLGDDHPVFWRVLARMRREDYEWACQRLRVTAQAQTMGRVVAAMHNQVLYELRRTSKLELDRTRFAELLTKALSQLQTGSVIDIHPPIP